MKQQTLAIEDNAWLKAKALTRELAEKAKMRGWNGRLITQAQKRRVAVDLMLRKRFITEKQAQEIIKNQGFITKEQAQEIIKNRKVL